MLTILIVTSIQKQNISNYEEAKLLRSKDPQLAVDFPNFQVLSENETREVFHCKHLYLVRDIDSNGQLKHCEMIEV